MKRSRWPLWSAFAMSSLIGVGALVFIHADDEVEREASQCVSNSSLCGAPTVTISHIFSY